MPSGWKRKVKRPGYEALLADIKAGKIDALIVQHLDRLTRQARENVALVDAFEAANLYSIESINGMRIDLRTADGQKYFRDIGSAAQYESHRKAERLQDKHRRLAEEGMFSGGRRPYGYVIIPREERAEDGAALAICPEEAKLIREAAKRILEGETLRGLCRSMNERGAKTSTGRPWHPYFLRYLLLSPTIAGLRRFRKQPTIVRAKWPAIIDDLTHHRLNQLLLDPARRQGGSKSRVYILSGYAYCGQCGARLKTHQNNGKRAYVCSNQPDRPGCGKLAALAEPIEEYVLKDALLMANHENGHQPDAERVKELLTAKEAAEEELKELARDRYNRKVIGDLEFQAAREDPLQRIKNISQELDRVKVTPEPDWEAIWTKGMTWTITALEDPQEFAHWRTLLEATVERVIVKPVGRGRHKFTPQRVEIVYREPVAV